MNIGTIQLDTPLTLGPMAGVTDAAFREVCRAQGAGLTATEMVSAKALVYGDRKTRDLLFVDPTDHPVAAQIFGHEPEVMAQAARIALDISGADIIDINMGCPVGKVVKSGDGSALMRTPELAGDIIAAVNAAVPVPVTVKFRKGWDSGSVNAVDFARMAQTAGAAAIAVHGRTRVQMYAGKADWDIIREVKQAVDIPVIANGDVFSGADAVHILKYTGADAAMIGRGSFGDPWLFARCKAAIEGRPEPELPPLPDRLDTAFRQVQRCAQLKGERVACVESRKQLAWYLKGVPHSAYYRSRLVQVTSLQELELIIREIRLELR